MDYAHVLRHIAICMQTHNLIQLHSGNPHIFYMDINNDTFLQDISPSDNDILVNPWEYSYPAHGVRVYAHHKFCRIPETDRQLDRSIRDISMK
jgi:hypothetical protein